MEQGFARDEFSEPSRAFSGERPPADASPVLLAVVAANYTMPLWDEHQIVELACIKCRLIHDSLTEVYEYSGMHDHGSPIGHADASCIGLTTGDIIGQHIDNVAVRRVLHDARAVVACGAEELRTPVEVVAPEFSYVPWVSAEHDIEWQAVPREMLKGVGSVASPIRAATRARLLVAAIKRELTSLSGAIQRAIDAASFDEIRLVIEPRNEEHRGRLREQGYLSHSRHQGLVKSIASTKQLRDDAVWLQDALGLTHIAIEIRSGVDRYSARRGSLRTVAIASISSDQAALDREKEAK